MAKLPLKVQFGSGGDYKLWAGDGWHHDNDDEQHTWAGHMAKLRLMMDHSGRDLRLDVDVIPLVAKGVEQELYVFLNGAFVAYWPVLEPGTKTALIESSFLNSPDCLFTFLAPKAICPKEAGLGNDGRVLGLAFRSVALTAAR